MLLFCSATVSRDCCIRVDWVVDREVSLVQLDPDSSVPENWPRGMIE